MKSRRKLYNCLIFGACFAVIAAVYAVIGCPFRFFLGVPCPGCGMTRAFFALLRFDFTAAFSFHPLIFIMPFIGAYIIARFIKKDAIFSETTEKVLLALVIVTFSAVYVFRLVSGNEVVQPDFDSSVLHKIITIILGAFQND